MVLPTAMPHGSAHGTALGLLRTDLLAIISMAGIDLQRCLDLPCPVEKSCMSHVRGKVPAERTV